MRCKMCGAKLKKDGDICKNCYEEYLEKEDLRSENEKEIFSISRKYSFKFNLLKNGELLILFLIIVLAAFATYGTFGGIVVGILSIIIFGMWMYCNKKRALGTKTTFYETKLKYKADNIFGYREEIIKYSEIKDIAFFQTNSQKIFRMADIRFYTNGFLNGLTICDIPDIYENFNKIKEIVSGQI